MEDTQNLKSLSKKDMAGVFVAKQRAGLVKDGIINETAPFIPKNGQISTELIFNASTGRPLSAKEMIPAILMKEKNGYESNVVGGYTTGNKAGTSIKQGEKGLQYIFQDKDGVNHSSSFFFPEQMEQPERLREFAKGNQKWEQRLSGETFKITSPEVSEYLATYVAACKSGAKVEVSPEVAEQFKANMLAVANNELMPTTALRDKNIPKMSDLLFNAEVKSTEIIKNREKELGITQKTEQQKEQKKQYERNQGMER